MLTKSSKNAIRAVLYLTRKGSIENKLSAKQIALDLEIAAPFLAKTMQKLTNHKIVTSVKGPNGGFYLSKENKKKTLFDVIASMDNLEKLDKCFLGQIECNDMNPCAIHLLYAPFRNKLINEFKTKSILEMANEYSINNNLSKTISL